MSACGSSHNMFPYRDTTPSDRQSGTQPQVYVDDDVRETSDASAIHPMEANSDVRSIEGSDKRIWGDKAKEYVHTSQPFTKSNDITVDTYVVDLDQHDSTVSNDVIIQMLDHGGVTLHKLYNEECDSKGTHTRHHTAFPMQIDEVTPEDVKVVRLEVRLPSESMNQLDLVASQRRKQSSGKGDPYSLDLALSASAIETQLASVLGCSQFDTNTFHGVILSAKILSAVNTTESTFDARLLFPNMSSSDPKSTYITHASPQGLCSPSLQADPSADMPERDNLFASCQFHVTIPAEHKGPLTPGLDKLYTVPERWSSPECRRWLNVNLSAALVEAQSIRVRDGVTMRIPEFTNAFRPDNLAQYILIAHEAELKHFCRQLKVDIPKLSTIMLKRENTSTGKMCWVINYNAYVLCLKYLHGIYSAFPVNLKAPIILSLTMRDGKNGWDDMAHNGLQHLDNNNHKPVRISVTVEIALVPFTGCHRITAEQRATIERSQKDFNDATDHMMAHRDAQLKESKHQVESFVADRVQAIEKNITTETKETQAKQEAMLVTEAQAEMKALKLRMKELSDKAVNPLIEAALQRSALKKE